MTASALALLAAGRRLATQTHQPASESGSGERQYHDFSHA
jgi:hypothetical protein